MCLFVCLFRSQAITPTSTPKGVDFCVHGRLFSCLKGSRAPSSGRFDMRAENLYRREAMERGEEREVGNVSFRW